MIWLISEDQDINAASTQAFNRSVGTYLVAHEPWHHLLSTEGDYATWALSTPADLTWVDYLALQVDLAQGGAPVQALASIPRQAIDTEDWYEQDDFWHAELTDTADVPFFYRWDYWSWMLEGGAASYGGRWTDAQPYSETGTLPYTNPVSGTNFTGDALQGLNSVPYLWSYFQSRGIDLSQFQSDDSLVTSWAGSGQGWQPNLTQDGTSQFLVYDPNASQTGADAHLASTQTASMTINLTSARGRSRWNGIGRATERFRAGAPLRAEGRSLLPPPGKEPTSSCGCSDYRPDRQP